MHEEPLPGPPRPVELRFELAALRLANAWLAARRVWVSADDLRIAGEFLARTGSTVEEVPGARVRLVDADGSAAEMTREAAVLLALRRLAAREERRRRAARAWAYRAWQHEEGTMLAGLLAATP